MTMLFAPMLEGLAQAGPLAPAVLAAESPASFWLPPSCSTAAEGVDWLFYFLLYVSAFFFVLIVTLMVVFVVRFRRRPGVDPGPSPSHNNALELFWTAIPVVIVVFIFYTGFVSYLDMRTSPRNAYEVQVVAKKWSWEFVYKNGVRHNELHVPVGEPVRLVMQSQDVIHSLFVPNFRIKADLVPGRYTSTWFQATAPGEHGLYCAEYCGAAPEPLASGQWPGHFAMTSKVVVHEPGGFEAWLENEANVVKRLPPVEAGKYLYERRGCYQCHSIDGSRGTGPSFKGLWGEEQRFTNASPQVVDEQYVRESILDPRAKIVEGFQPIMPSYQGSLKDDEIGAIIEFIKSLK